jgi:hypothetical protein
MPKPKKTKGKKSQERENWSWNGLIVGALFGVPIYYSAIGRYDNYPLVRLGTQILVVLALLFGLASTVKYSWKHKAVVNPFFDGIVSGLGLSATVLGILLHGIGF